MEITYNSYLKANPHFTMRNLAVLIKKSIDEETPYRIENIELGGLKYTISFNPEPDEYKLQIKWVEDGETYKRDIYVRAERSNLPTLKDSYVYYFLCPRTGRKCRTLYKIGCYFWSRSSFRHHYSGQNQSHYDRVISAREEPYKRYGKKMYKGKLTPYGKRCMRYQIREDKSLEVMQYKLNKIIGYGFR